MEEPLIDGEQGMSDPSGNQVSPGGGDEDDPHNVDGSIIADGIRSGDRTPTVAADKEEDDEEREEEKVNDDPEDGNEGNLWEQMRSREGRAAARRAGMRAGDWQAEKQLQEALRESCRDEEGFVEAGSCALSTSAIDIKGEGDSAPHQVQAARGSGCAGPGAASLREGHTRKKGDPASAAPEEKEGEELELEEDEDYGDYELVVTQDGGVNPGVFEVERTEETPAAVMAFEPRRADNPTISEVVGRRRNRGGVGKKGKQRASAAVAKGRLGLDSRSCVVKPPLSPALAALASVSVPEEDRKDQLRKKNRDEKAKAEACHGTAAVTTVENVAEIGGQGGPNKGERRDGEQGQLASSRRREDMLLRLSDDVLHRTMLFLQPEDICECRAVNSQWTFPQHEAVFEGLCRRTYLAQSEKKLLNVKRWRSWQRMFKLRPRLRESGLYSLKTTYIKKPVRDMSTAWVPGTILEVTYYRYFRFFGNGRVAYGLTHEKPNEFVRLLEERSPKVAFGTYTINKWEVKVVIENPWSSVTFELQLANGENGRFTHLVLVSHSSLPLNDPRAGRYYHRVTSSDYFAFRRIPQF